MNELDEKVYLTPCETYDEDLITSKLKELLIDNHLLDFVIPGLKIGLKVNLVSAMKPSLSATTNPVLVKVLSKLLIDKGAIVTIGDSPGGVFNQSALKNNYQVTRMIDSIDVGAILNNIFSSSIVDVKGKVLKKLDLTDWIKEQDVIINVCKLKSHAMMGLSCAVKNLFGVVPGLLKPEYHYRFPKHEAFADMLIDINEYVNCQLNIVDAVMGMEGNGPTMGSPRFIGLLLASKNPYAVDYLACQLIKMDYHLVPTVTQSIKRGKITEQITFDNGYEKYIVSDFQKIQPHNDMSFRIVKGPIGELVNKFCGHFLKVKPLCNKNTCIGCQKCANICPAKAITIKNNKPVINRNKCIRCFCCQEFCPVGAMITKKHWIIKLLSKNKKTGE